MFSQIAIILALFYFTAAMIYAALQDAQTLRIPNRLVLAIAGAYLIFAPLAGFGPVFILQSVGAAGLCLLLTFALFAFGLTGGGDAKLVAAGSLWLGPEGAILFLIYTMLIGGVLAAAVLLLRAAPLPAPLASHGWMLRVQSPAFAIPYALAISPAALLVLPTTTWFALLA